MASFINTTIGDIATWFYIADDVQNNISYYPMFLNFTNWAIGNSNLILYGAMVNCSFANSSNFGGGSLQNFFLLNNTFASESSMLSLNVQDPNNFTCEFDGIMIVTCANLTKYFYISNFTMQESIVFFLKCHGLELLWPLRSLKNLN